MNQEEEVFGGPPFMTPRELDAFIESGKQQMTQQQPRQKILWVDGDGDKNSAALFALQTCGKFDVQVVPYDEYVGNGITGKWADLYILDDLSDEIMHHMEDRVRLIRTPNAAAPPKEPKSKKAQWKTERQRYKRK